MAKVVLITVLLTAPSALLDRLGGDERNRLPVTLAVWTGAVVLTELWPVRDAA